MSTFFVKLETASPFFWCRVEKGSTSWCFIHGSAKCNVHQVQVGPRLVGQWTHCKLRWFCVQGQLAWWSHKSLVHQFLKHILSKLPVGRLKQRSRCNPYIADQNHSVVTVDVGLDKPFLCYLPPTLAKPTKLRCSNAFSCRPVEMHKKPFDRSSLDSWAGSRSWADRQGEKEKQFRQCEKKLGDLAFGYAWIVCFESFKFTESILNITQNPPPQVKDLLSKPL